MSKKLATSRGVGEFRTARAVLALVLALSLLVPAAALADQPPGNPHYFYGTVKTGSGIALPAGTPVTVSALGTQRGQTTVDAQGRYGYSPLFFVPADIQDGTAITFTVGGAQAQLYDVATGQSLSSYPFAIGGLTNLNLKADVTYVITPTATAGGTIMPDTPQTVPYGGSKKFDIAPSSGFTITKVAIDGVSKGMLTTYTFNNVTASHTIAATFDPLTYVITPTAGPGGTITPGTPLTVTYDASAAFTVTANTGYKIVDVGVDGVSQGALPSYTFTKVRADHFITASFQILTYVITPTAGPGGTLTPGTPQAVTYDASATFTVTANTGYKIVDVGVDGVSQGVLPDYTFTKVRADHTITATFTPLTYTITATAGTGGAISPAGAVVVAYGTDKTFTITPNFGFVIAAVKVDGATVGALPSYTFTNVTQTHTIAATFISKRYLPLIIRVRR